MEQGPNIVLLLLVIHTMLQEQVGGELVHDLANMLQRPGEGNEEATKLLMSFNSECWTTLHSATSHNPLCASKLVLQFLNQKGV